MELDTAAVTESAERTLKLALRYLSAWNQSRAKVVLDPIYEGVAALLLRDVSCSPKLLSTRIEDDLYPRYLQQSRRLQYSVHDWDFSQARPDLLTGRQKRLLHSFAMGETSGFAVGGGFLRSFRNVPELGSFFGIWFTEELNHYWGYHRYLERMGEGWSMVRKEAVTGVDFRDYSDDPMEVAAANMYQELIAYLIYRSYAKQVRDPFLARMLETFAKDELRHFKFYEAVVAREIQRRPGFRVKVLKHFFKATTPVNQVAGGASNVVESLAGAAFYFRRPEFEFFLKQSEFLFGRSFGELFGFFYRRHLPPCVGCREEVYLCGCEEFEPLAREELRTGPVAAVA